MTKTKSLCERLQSSANIQIFSSSMFEQSNKQHQAATKCSSIIQGLTVPPALESIWNSMKRRWSLLSILINLRTRGLDSDEHGRSMKIMEVFESIQILLASASKSKVIEIQRDLVPPSTCHTATGDFLADKDVEKQGQLTWSVWVESHIKWNTFLWQNLGLQAI